MSDPPTRDKKGQTERLPLPDDASPQGEQLGSALDPVASHADVDLPDVEYEDLTGEVLAGSYKLDAHLADGGMGSVYRATHLRLSMRVAVKVMLPAMSRLPGYARRFRREARAMSALSHRNVVRVHDYGIHDERPFIVMELLEGQSIAEWLKHCTELPSLKEIDELVGQVLDGLTVAHGAGIVHRDLKPDNIFLAAEGDGVFLVKLLDFGLAHMDDPSDRGPTLTQSNMVSGTPEYMSPEQCQSLQVGPSTDIYALGCILTELLQGSPPFLAGTQMLTMSQQMFMAPPPLDRPPDAEPVPPLLERLRLQMLAKDPLERPANVKELRERWREALTPAANRAAFPDRKRGDLGGDRTERAVTWTSPAPRPEPSAHPDALRVGLVHLAGAAIDESRLVALAAAGIAISPVSPPLPRDLDGVILEAAGDVDAACAWMAAHLDEALPRPVLCIDADGDAVAQLVAAGAGDIESYPVQPAQLARKLRKIARRFRRRH